MSTVPNKDPGAAAYHQLFEQAQRRAAQEQGGGKAPGGIETLTPEEGERFKKAFDDPEFRKLFAGYMDELQDPANRSETEEYISQLEGEKKVPAGKELIRPRAAFVVKTHKMLPAEKGKQAEKGDKVFVNIVQSEKITAPTKTPSKEGVHWSLPYSVGPPHMELDKSGTTNVACFDCCFHPEAVATSALSKQFKDLVIQTAMDGIEASYKRNAPPGSADAKTKLDREGVHVLKGVTYKSGDLIPTMLIDSTLRRQEWEAATGQSSGANAGTGSSTANAAAAKLAGAAAGTSVAAGTGTGGPREVVPPNKPATTGTTVNTAPKAPKAAPAIKKGFLDRSIKKEAAIPTIRKPAPAAAASAAGVGAGAGAGASDILLSREAAAAAEEQSGDGSLPSLSDVTGSRDAKRGALVQEVAPGSTSTSTGSKATGSLGASSAAAAAAPVAAGFEMKATSTQRRQPPPATSKEPSGVTSSSSSSRDSSSGTDGATNGDNKSPRYTLSERGSQEHATQQFESIAAQYVASSRPAELVYRIELPRVTKASAVALDVQQQRLLLSYQDIYALDVNPLPYPIFEDRGNAKYDKASRTLTVTLPVRPVEVTRVLESKAAVSVASSSDAEAGAEGDSGDNSRGSSSSPSKLPASAKKVKDPHAKWLGNKDAADAADSAISSESTGISLSEEIRRKAAEAVEAYQKQPPAPPVARRTVATEHMAKSTDADSASSGAAAMAGKDFYPSGSFAGRKPGYVFKLDEARGGLGYHRDRPPHHHHQQQQQQQEEPQQQQAQLVPPTPPQAHAKVQAEAPAAVPAAAALQPFPMEYRQHLHCLSIIVDVPNVVSSSVVIDYAAGNSVVTVTFSAPAEGSEGDNSGSSELVHYGLALQMPAASAPSSSSARLAVNPAECSFDAAARNMVLVLTKKEHAMWLESGDGVKDEAGQGVPSVGGAYSLTFHGMQGVLTTYRLQPSGTSNTKQSTSARSTATAGVAVSTTSSSASKAVAGARGTLSQQQEAMLRDLTFSGATGGVGSNLLFELD